MSEHSQTGSRAAEPDNGWRLLHDIRPWLTDYAIMMNEHATDPKLPQSLREMAKTRANEVIDVIRRIP